MINILNKKKLSALAKILPTILITAFLLTACEKDQVYTPSLNVPGCDVSSVTFSKTIKPIIDDRCVSCHSSSNSMGGVNLEGYDNIRSCAQSGKLTTSIQRSMKDYLRDECEALKIVTWVKNKSPND